MHQNRLPWHCLYIELVETLHTVGFLGFKSGNFQWFEQQHFWVAWLWNSIGETVKCPTVHGWCGITWQSTSARLDWKRGIIHLQWLIWHRHLLPHSIYATVFTITSWLTEKRAELRALFTHLTGALSHVLVHRGLQNGFLFWVNFPLAVQVMHSNNGFKLFISEAKINGVSLGWLLIFVDYLYTTYYPP